MSLQPKLRCQTNPLNEDDLTNGLMDMCHDCIRIHMVGVEVGSFRGISAEVFATKCKHITCIDPWDLASNNGYKEIDRQALMNAEVEFDLMMSKYKNISKIKKFSSKAVDMFDDRSLDFVYLDGAHDLNNVLLDLKIWIPKIKDNGFISGHDYNMIKNILYNKNIKVLTYKDTSWISRVTADNRGEK